MNTSILLPGIGNLVEILDQHDLELSFPGDALALVHRNDAGYAFTWEACY
jgi:hypothetical protein